MANTRSIQDPQGTLALGTPFLGIQGMIGRATQGSIWLWRKRGAGKAMSKRGTCPLRRTIDDHQRGLFSRDGLEQSKRTQPPVREQMWWCIALLKRAVALVPVAGSRSTAPGSGQTAFPHGV